LKEVVFRKTSGIVLIGAAGKLRTVRFTYATPDLSRHKYSTPTAQHHSMMPTLLCAAPLGTLWWSATRGPQADLPAYPTFPPKLLISSMSCTNPTFAAEGTGSRRMLEPRVRTGYKDAAPAIEIWYSPYEQDGLLSVKSMRSKTTQPRVRYAKAVHGGSRWSADDVATVITGIRPSGCLVKFPYQWREQTSIVAMLVVIDHTTLKPTRPRNINESLAETNLFAALSMQATLRRQAR